MKIHKEGHKILIKTFSICFGVVFGAFFYLGHMPFVAYSFSISAIAFFLLLLQFFRYPERQLVTEDNLIIAPADGKIVVIEDTLENEYFKDKRKQISIFMSPINVHVNRNPLSGVVKYIKHHPGLFFVAWHPKASKDNERTTIVVKHKNGTEVLFQQIAGALSKRICTYIKIGDRVKQSEDFGFIKFGSRVDLFLPLDTEIKVELNQTTKGGITVIAALTKKQQK